MGEGLADVSGERIVVYVSIGVVIVLALATATDKGLGPITRWWYAFARDRRQAAADKRTAAYDELMAQVTDLRRQLRYTRGEHAKEMAKVRAAHDLELAELRRDIGELRAEVRQRDELVQQHLPWDRGAVDSAARHGEDLGPPPPLWPR